MAKKEKNNTDNLVETIKNAVIDKKGVDLVILNLKPIDSAVCDYFVICSGNSDTHVKSIGEEIERAVKHIHNENVYQKEGYQNAQWVLLDYGDVVVHIFQKETRSYYNLEGLWADAKIEEVALVY